MPGVRSNPANRASFGVPRGAVLCGDGAPDGCSGRQHEPSSRTAPPAAPPSTNGSTAVVSDTISIASALREYGDHGRTKT